MPPPTLTTPRLILRPWRDNDLEPFAALNADPRVMQHFPKTLTREESDQVGARIRTAMNDRGFGFWAVEIPGIAPFIGFTGLAVPSFQAHFTPCVEIGWRLARQHWGYGYATEAASVALAYGFDTLRLDQIVAFTVPANERSRAVMHRLGMTCSPADNFLHPNLPGDNPLRPHILYRINRSRAASMARSGL